MGAPPLPPGKFGVILADPPWSFQTYSENGKGRSPEQHYSCMSMEDIKALDIGSLAAEDCALFMWVINSMLPHAMEVVKAWGFTYKTVAFDWVKTNRNLGLFMGLGYWTRQNSEQCWLATRGHPKRLNADVPMVIMSPRREHSRKPDEQYGRIERLVAGPYIELFARGKNRRGWTVWGDQAVQQ